jgi:hypothetical protein
LKENVEEANTVKSDIKSIINKLNAFATSKGLTRSKPSKDAKLSKLSKNTAHYLAKWEDETNTVELFYTTDDPNDLRIDFDESNIYEPVKDWLKQSTWDKHFKKSVWTLKKTKQAFDNQRDESLDLASDLAYFVYDNFAKITGLPKSQRAQEGDFPIEIEDFIDEYLPDGVYDNDFLSSYGANYR